MLKQRCLAALTIAFLASWANADDNVDPAGRAARMAKSHEAIVKAAYARLTELAAEGGSQLYFSIEGFTDLPARDFGRTLWVDVVTPPGGEMVDVTRIRKSREGEFETVLYQPKWRLDGADYVESDEGRSLLGMTIDEVIDARLDEDPEVATIEGLTAFDVIVHFDGRSRAYRAAFMWVPKNATRDTGLYVLDNITQGVARAAEEKVVDRVAPMIALASGDPDAGLACTRTESAMVVQKIAKGYNGHTDSLGLANGYHQAYAKVGYRCNCESDCTATCVADILESSCEERGTSAWLCHSMGQDAAERQGASFDGTTLTPKCAAGFGCAQRSCAFCWCDMLIQANVSENYKVTFGTSTPPEWVAKLEFDQSGCRPCERLSSSMPSGPDTDHDGEIPGGTGGGAVNTCCWRNTSCKTNSLGQYVCVPTTCGQYGC